MDTAGKPFFLLGDTPWFLQRLPLDDVRRIMDDRRAKGFNTLYLEILDDSRIPSRDAHSNIAFRPETDITRPVDAYWRYADTVLNEAARRGFFVFMSDFWYGAGDGLWIHHVTAEKAKIYGHFLGKRYARFKNLIDPAGAALAPAHGVLALVEARSRCEARARDRRIRHAGQGRLRDGRPGS